MIFTEEVADRLCKVLFQTPKGPPKEMVTPLIRKSLEKQGYKLIGSHSGVKMCRWTKVDMQLI